MNKLILLLSLAVSSSATLADINLDCRSADGKTEIKTDRMAGKGLIIKLIREGSLTRYFRVHPLTLQNNILFVKDIDAGEDEVKISLGKMNTENKYPRVRLNGVIAPYLQSNDRLSKPEVLKAYFNCSLNGEIDLANVCIENDDSIYTHQLFEAAARGDADKMQQSLACGAEIDAINEQGCTPLMVSSLTTNNDCGYPVQSWPVTDSFFFAKKNFIFKYLLSESANTNLKDPKGETIAHKLVNQMLAELIKPLKDNGADLDGQDVNGMTPLMRAALNNYEKGVTELVQAEANLEKRNVLGQNAYDLGNNLSKPVRAMLLPGSNAGIIIQGAVDGSCSPKSIKLKMGKPSKLVLKANAKDMFVLTSSDLGINIMAMPNGSASQVVETNKMGTFKFQCGVHGGAQMTGEIVVSM
jgi:heme/copper-type cytochrome/quinol oxidase subunit 2